MDAQMLTVIAQLEPAQRIGFAQAQGVPPQVLLQLEAAAQQAGLELNGGSLREAFPELFGSGDGGADSDDEDESAVPLSSVLSVAKDRAWSLGAGLAFFVAVPVLLYIVKERRGMTWRELAESIGRLPFSD